MQPFSTLTARGQALRLRRMALVALEHYEVVPRRVSLVANHLNGIFRVDAADGRRYALRINHPTWRTRDDLEAELAWMAALEHDTDIGAPTPFPNRDGALITTVATPYVPEPRRCVLFSWIGGTLLAERLTPNNLVEFGRLSARLHGHAIGFVPPAGLAIHTMRTLYARDESDALFTDACQEFFTPSRSSRVRQVGWLIRSA